ncbi:hypothetical protein, partial [Acinetobacter baumannii]|uniref:hypothetical protein n=1 Tax=Acinetobacter baumannii TaxID=470 RepID=UPI001D17CCD9
MKSHDHLLDRQYDDEHYNCVHFVHEAAMDLYGIDRAEALELFMQPKGKITFLSSRLKLLNPLPMPKEGCIVAFHPRQRNKPPHVGLFRGQKIGEFKHEVRQFEKSYDNQQAEQISLM